MEMCLSVIGHEGWKEGAGEWGEGGVRTQGYGQEWVERNGRTGGRRESRGGEGGGVSGGLRGWGSVSPTLRFVWLVCLQVSMFV